MHRARVLDLLREHGARDLEEQEASMLRAMVAFVSAQPDCLARTCIPGHLTGSAWVVSLDRTRTLLTHHLKLNKWLQLGGHADGDPDILAVALREAQEESGLSSVRPISTELFDVDRHWIPERRGEAGHFHFDLRFLIEADASEPLVRSSESKDLAWVGLARVNDLNPEESMARMVRKTRGCLPGT